MQQETVAISLVEGDGFNVFVPHTPPPDWRGNLVHAILFSDGRIWDAANGFRPRTYPSLVRLFRPEPIDAAGWAEAAF